MRVRPSVGLGIGIAVVYMAVFGGLFYASGVDYVEVADTAANVRNAIVIPLAVAAVLLIIVTSVFGWWGPVLRDRRRAGGWVIAVPIVLVIAVLAGIDYQNLSELDSELVLWIGIAVALVGFCEELVYRGLVVVSFRSSLKEVHVWLWSSVAFSLLHSINFALGQDVGPTLQQLVLTFMIGSGFYIARRTTGMLIVPMVMHLLWDYSSFTQGEGHTIAALMQWVALLAVIVGLTAGRKHLFGTAEQPVDEAVVA